MSEEYYSTTFCVECGPDVKVDEDGCCASCGGAAIGPYAEKYGELEADVERLEMAYEAAGASAVHEHDRAEAAEAKLAAIEGLPRYLVRIDYLHMSWVKRADGSWIKYADIHAILRGEEEDTNDV